jgi:fimbrial chaperone protein
MKNILAAAVISFAFQTTQASFEISPIIVTAAPAGAGATVTLTATNTGSQKTPVQIAIVHREPDINGVEKYTDAKDTGEVFQIIPSQFILKPNEKRSVRITYVGDPLIKQELAFRIIAEEFPIDVTDPEKVKNKAVASISILSKYIASLYVKPLNTSPDITIDASIGKENKETKLILHIKNKGTEHKVLKQVKYKAVTVSDKKEYPLPLQVEQEIGAQNILAGKTRKFTLSWPNGIPVVPLKVSIDTSKK